MDVFRGLHRLQVGNILQNVLKKRFKFFGSNYRKILIDL